MKNCAYSHSHTISKAYNIVNKTEKFRESIKSWNHLPPIQQTWIAFKTHFQEAHIEITKTGEFTFKEAGHRQSNLLEDIVSRFSAEFRHQANIVNITPPKYPAAAITGTAELLQQVIAKNQELMRLLSAKDGKSVRENTNRLSSPSTGPCQGQPSHPMTVYFDKY